MKLKLIRRSVVAASMFGLALSVVSCSSTKKADSADVQAAPVSETKAEPVETATPVSAVDLRTIYFDFNRFDIKKDQRASASAMADSLKVNPSVKIQIQGNTDDRGSVEYNMALGTKRAESLKKFLVTAGVNAENISTISYGKEHPVATNQDEDSRSKNRRDDVVVQN